MKMPKISNPKEFVDIAWEDLGDARPWCNADGELYEAFTTLFCIGNFKIFSIFPKEVGHAISGSLDVGSEAFMDSRFEYDCNTLKRYDVDLKAAFNDLTCYVLPDGYPK